MTFNDVIEELRAKIEAAKAKLLEAQNPNNEFAHNQYWYLTFQIYAQRALDKAEDDLLFFVEFIDEHQIDKNLLTGGLEVLILSLDREK